MTQRLSACPHRAPLHDAVPGQRSVLLCDDPLPRDWEVVVPLVAHRGWPMRDPLTLPPGTHLRLLQADSTWTDVIRGTVGWFHFLRMNGRGTGGCVVVESTGHPDYRPPPQLVPAGTRESPAGHLDLRRPTVAARQREVGQRSTGA
jgi:hypothetical protein